MEIKELSANEVAEAHGLVECMSMGQLRQLQAMVTEQIGARHTAGRMAALEQIRAIAASVGMTAMQLMGSGRGRPLGPRGL